MGSPLDPPSSVDAALHEFDALAQRGNAIVYDSVFSSGIRLPSGAAALVLSRTAGSVTDTMDDCPIRFSYAHDMAAMERADLFEEERRTLRWRWKVLTQAARLVERDDVAGSHASFGLEHSELQRQALFYRLLAECPDGVREVVGVPLLWERAIDGAVAARQDWYAQLCYDLVSKCVSLVDGELELQTWASIQAVVVSASQSWATGLLDEPMRPMCVHACANDTLSQRSELGCPMRVCCCWLTFESTQELVAGEVHDRVSPEAADDNPLAC